MSLKFKGNKGVKDFLPASKKIKKKEENEKKGYFPKAPSPDPFADDIKEKKTQAELTFELTRKNRVASRVEKKMNKNYKGKVEYFNKFLAKLPMHFDIPKIGPG